VPSAYAGVNFSSRARQAGLALPSIHVVPLNCSTQYDKKASKAFGAMYEEIKSRVEGLKAQMPQYFSLPKSTSAFLDIPDAHAVSVVASHHGMPLGGIKVKRYDIHGIDTQVNNDPLQRYKQAADQLVSLL
jgi:hypothetical protein